MIHTIKNTKWVITTSLVCITLGVLTFLTFIDKSFIKLNDLNLQILLLIDLVFLILFFGLVIHKAYKIFKQKKEGKLGYHTSLRYIVFFTTTTLLPSIFVAIFSLVLFNLSIQQYFNKKIKSIVHNSREVALNYVNQTRSSIQSDVSLMTLDINKQFNLFYDNPKMFLNILSSHRMLRKLDEVHLLDSSGDIIMSNTVDEASDYVAPPDEAFIRALNGQPIRILDPNTNRSSALVKLSNFIDTYLYIVRFIDPKLINYLKETNQAIGFYYTVRDQKLGIKISFVAIYVLIVSLLLFLSVIISINFASRLTKPIVNLIGASEKISSGDLNAKVPMIATDKGFEKLNMNFNLMIDKLKKQQDKLLLSERHEAWENVARKLAHEIKNPLTPIQLSIDRIREKYLKKETNDNKNFSNYLNIMVKQIKDIENLVNEFSDFARMPKPKFKKNNLNQIIIRSISLHEQSEPHLDFIFNKDSTTYFVKADEEQFNRVFVNLIKNSIESINTKKSQNVDFKGKINVEITSDSDYIYVNIIDNGVGFNQIDKKKMLSPYFTTKKNGTGLGLAIVTKIINDHNSLIDFYTINDGAKITITIPKYE